MPGAPPSWIHLTPDEVLAGHIGDGGLPNSTLARIDQEAFEIVVVVIPTGPEGADHQVSDTPLDELGRHPSHDPRSVDAERDRLILGGQIGAIPCGELVGFRSRTARQRVLVGAQDHFA